MARPLRVKEKIAKAERILNRLKVMHGRHRFLYRRKSADLSKWQKSVRDRYYYLIDERTKLLIEVGVFQDKYVTHSVRASKADKAPWIPSPEDLMPMMG